MTIRRAQPSEVREIMDWIAARHYLQCVPAGCVYALEFIDHRGRVGAMLLGRPIGKNHSLTTLELTRVYFNDSEISKSRALAMMRKYVRTWLQSVRLLMAYSDPEQGHEGKIYEADGWAPFGKSGSHGLGWHSRGGRKEAHGHAKLRWVRTP